MAKKAAAKEVQLETVLWNCRVALRGVGSMEKGCCYWTGIFKVCRGQV